MTPSTRRRLRYLGIAVAVLLVVLALYPGTLASPYLSPQETTQYSHAVTPESSDTYEEWTEEFDPDYYRYEELSPEARELFDRTRTAEPSEHGWERTFTPRICRDVVLVCDGYVRGELPEEFTYGEELTPDEALVIVQHGEDRYLLKTGEFGHGDRFALPIRPVGVWLTLLPLALFVGGVAVSATTDRALAGTVGGGALVGVLGFLAPYLEMIGVVPVPVLGGLLLVSVWTTVLVSSGYRLYRATTDDDRSPFSGEP